MNFLKIEITADSGCSELLSAALYDLLPELEIIDEAEFSDYVKSGRGFDYIEQGLPQSIKGCRVTAYVADTDDGNATLAAVRDKLSQIKQDYSELSAATIKTDVVRDEDWANNWKQYYHRFKIGGVTVNPAWERYDGDGIVFNIEPGSAFGAGTHESTQMCVLAAQQYVANSSTVLDIGCGTGILSIVSLMLGARNADALDVDCSAVAAARANAELNGIDVDKYNVLQGDIINNRELLNDLRADGYDVIFSNIVADVIIRLIPIVRGLLKSGGKYIMSGIITERAEQVKRQLRDNGFDVVCQTEQNDWVCIVAKT